MMRSLDSASDVATYWDRWARVWNPFLRAVHLDRKYRREGISVLELEKGMVVLDIACGTGFNFPYLVGAIGPRGRIVAVDISPAMLQRAKAYALDSGWDNIQFVLGDVAETRLPEADAAAAFWCMVSIPKYQEALSNIVSSLRVGGRVSLLDFKLMNSFPGQVLNPIFKMVGRVTHQDVAREPWLFMEDLLGSVEMREWKFAGLFLSNVYLAWGQRD
ncbi:MAG: methyltransferase domain-containing protein [candidate division Zixibacteria bacterium]|nr:methyltransferase domain-containing protein [candidate division Zixibacteria bacterium]